MVESPCRGETITITDILIPKSIINQLREGDQLCIGKLPTGAVVTYCGPDGDGGMVVSYKLDDTPPATISLGH